MGEKESVATYLLPDGTEKDQFTFANGSDRIQNISYSTIDYKAPRVVHKEWKENLIEE